MMGLLLPPRGSDEYRDDWVSAAADASSSLLLSVTDWAPSGELLMVMAVWHSDEDEESRSSDLHLAALTFDTGAYIGWE